VSQINDVLGVLLDGLRARGLEEETIVVYNSDHGCYHGIHGLPEKAPGICSDAVCRVPMIWRVPGVTQAGAVNQNLIENIDLASTLPDLCNLPPMESTDGADIAPLLEGGETPVRELALTENAWSKAMRWGRYRFVHYPDSLFGEPWAELYDMETDPNETENLAFREDHQALVERCRARLLDALVQTTRVRRGQPGAHPEAGDGRESNLHGGARRLREGNRNYL
jgi:arylsulfatase A-like enzyme